MKTILKWAGYVAGGLVVLLLVATAALYAGSTMAMGRRYPLGALGGFKAADGPAAVAQGAELIKVLGCTDCHGTDLRGRLFDDQPLVARMYAPNLTLRARTWSDADFERAIRHGQRPDGRSLYIMPSGIFSRFSDEQTGALIAYIRSLPAGGPEQPPLQVGPLGRVVVLTGGVAPEVAAAQDAPRHMPFDAGPEHAETRTFVSRTCAECHGADLGGSEATHAPDLRVAAAYDLDDFKILLRTGKGAGGRTLGLMSDVAPVRYGRLPDARIEAIHAYLRARALKAPLAAKP